MFTAELKVNGVLIGVLYGHNEGYVDNGSDVCIYTWVYHRVDSMLKPQFGEVDHARSAGLAKLVGNILKNVEAS